MWRKCSSSVTQHSYNQYIMCYGSDRVVHKLPGSDYSMIIAHMILVHWLSWLSYPSGDQYIKMMYNVTL